MDEFWIYGLFIVGGFLLGGAFTTYKSNKLVSGILGALGLLAAVGGILQLV
ncbi:hypothetical protein [Tomitella biformata]|uniref:hypothetical protein n=1 Tax=Tomitella biformata TaxID=630403 RepID=UPI0004671337|nr:hypothetical protein [Tomitella biformata]